ncbi:hypothetical protein HYH03_012925 [Edaphochlamys debaryana]|uniref:Uncharacterized protein n=1 Tax=Edaphochlamys debaryana TaxID=47281 RepID=A0A836BV24_9CHLO|nr:hypothetical protein HYH03_012925 [Edaphochlamys debaryana]|eukprot:KAG2488608.1 hypothetical protein HYH03_012925 [Edaphochlamys debaryana]
MYGRLYGWEAAKAALTTEGSTLGLISALLITLSFAALLDPPDECVWARPWKHGVLDTEVFGRGVVLRFFTYAAALATVCSLISVALSSFLVMGMGIATGDRLARIWIDKYSVVAPVNSVVFAGSIGGLVALTCTTLAARHEGVDAVILIAIVVAASLVITVAVLRMYSIEYIVRMTKEYTAARAAHALAKRARLEAAGSRERGLAAAAIGPTPLEDATKRDAEQGGGSGGSGGSVECVD